MTYYLIVTPLGLCYTEFPEPNSLNWLKFRGDDQEIAEIYFQLLNESKIDLFNELDDTKPYLTDQKFLFELVRNNFSSFQIDLKSPLECQRCHEFIFQSLSLEEKEKLDDISKLYANLVVQRHSEAQDVYIGQAIHAIDDITKTINLFGNRLSEWYGLHFPEVVQTTSDIAQLFKFITQIGERKNFTEKTLADLSKNKRERLINHAQNSLGVEISEQDLRPMQTLAQQGLDLVRTKRELEKYIETATKDIMPNVVALVGPLIAARLLAYSGSLMNLAKMPASTIQLLGAEKALFRHLKTGDNPPKHGIIFQSAAIHTAPFHQRGKIARALAGKISIAARIDYFSGENQATKLANEFKQRTDEIAKKFPKPPVRKKQPSKGKKPRKPRKKYSGDRKKDKRTPKSRQKKKKRR